MEYCIVGSLDDGAYYYQVNGDPLVYLCRDFTEVPF